MIKRIQATNQQALSALYDLYAPVLYPMTLRILSSVEEAEDLLQEIFLQVWEKASTFDPARGTVYSWLMAMTRNRAIDRLRSKSYKKRSKEVVLEPMDEAASSTAASNPDEMSMWSESREIILTALKQLTGSQKQILELSYYKGFSQVEIARILKLPLGTVKTRMRQGIQKLRDIVGLRLEKQ